MSNIQKRILVLSSADTETNQRLNDEFVAGINHHLGDDIDISWLHYDELGFHFKGGKITVFLTANGQPLERPDFVYFKSYYRYTENALTFIEYCEQESVPFICSELRGAISFSKLSQYAKLSRANLPIPETLFVAPSHLRTSYQSFVRILGLPFIFKATDAKGGGSNYLIEDQESYTMALQHHPRTQFVAQKFIPNESDLRILVLNNKVELIIKRQRQDASTHLNNTSQGGNAVLIDPQDLSEDRQQLAVSAAQLMKREVAGVDLMFASDTGEPYLLEVNASPQVASGAFVEEKIEKYGNFLKNMLQ